MEQAQALAIVKSLANGVDPESGEVFPADGAYQRPQTVRALFAAVEALERAAPTFPRKPGLVERPAYAYLRHGTQCLIATFDVATGRVVTSTIGPSRT